MEQRDGGVWPLERSKLWLAKLKRQVKLERIEFIVKKQAGRISR